MEHNVFEEPVWIYVGLNIPQALSSVSHAHAFLLDVPQRMRGLGYAAALKACRAALDRQIDAETARASIAAFAEKAGILAPELDDLVAARAAAALASGAAA